MASEWRTATVQQLVKEGVLERPIDGNHGEIHPKASDFVQRGIPFIMASNLVDGCVDTTNCAFITEEQARTLRKGFAKPGDVLISHKATMGRTAVVGELEVPFLVLSPQVTYFRIKDSSRLLNRYLKCYFDSPKFQHLFQTWGNKGSTRAYLGITAQLDLPIVLPPINEQRAIAHILGTLDDKIELNRKQNETLEAMARALFKVWFVDFEPVRAKMEGRWQRDESLPGLPAHLYDLFPDRLVESELGEIPEGWKYAPLSQFIEILDSRRVPLSSKQRAERRGIYPYHGAAGVMDFVDDYLFDGIHVLIGEDGSVVKDNGCPYTQYVWGKFWVNNHAHVLRGRGITNETLLIFLDQCDIAPLVTGAVQPKLSQGNLKKIPFIDAGDQLINGFGEVIDPIFKQIRDATEESRTLAQLRDTLLPKLISGELRVHDAERFLKERGLR